MELGRCFSRGPDCTGSIFFGWWHLVAFIDHFKHLCEIVRHHLSFVLCQGSNVWIEYTISLFQIRFYTAVFYGIIHRISPVTFLKLKIQLETARFEPRTYQVSV